MSLQIPAALGTNQPYIPFVDPDQAAKLIGPPIRLTRARFNAAVTAEQTNITNGTPLWPIGQVLIVTDEPSNVRHEWNGSNAQTIYIKNEKFTLAFSTSVVLSVVGRPTGGNDGDFAVDDYDAIWSRAGGAWNPNGFKLPAYLGPVTAKSSMPKLVGGLTAQGGKLRYRLTARANKLVFLYCNAGTANEAMKAVTSGSITNGYWDVRVTMFLDGQTLAVTPRVASPLGARYQRVYMGDCDYLVINLPRYMEKGETVDFKNIEFGVSHNDPRSGGYAGFQLGYAALDKSNEQFFYNGNNSQNQAAWEAVCDTPGFLGAFSTATFGEYGLRPWNILAVIDTPTPFIGGDSRNNGQDINARYSESFPGVDARTGANGELSTVFRDVGLMNGGIYTEHAQTVNNASAFAARRKGAEYCSDFVFAWGINDASILNDESTCISVFSGLVTQITGLLATVKRRIWASTITPNPSSTDKLMSISGQTPNQFWASLRKVNGAVRRLLVGNNAFIDPCSGVDAGYDSGYVKIPPNVRTLNTGNYVIVVNSNGVTTMTAPSAVFQPNDSLYSLVIAGAGYNGDVSCECHFVSPTQLRLMVKNSRDQPSQLHEWDFAAAFSGSPATLTINAASNNILMGAMWLTEDLLHFNKAGEEEMYVHNHIHGYNKL